MALTPFQQLIQNAQSGLHGLLAPFVQPKIVAPIPQKQVVKPPQPTPPPPQEPKSPSIASSISSFLGAPTINAQTIKQPSIAQKYIVPEVKDFAKGFTQPYDPNFKSSGPIGMGYAAGQATAGIPGIQSLEATGFRTGLDVAGRVKSAAIGAGTIMAANKIAGNKVGANVLPAIVLGQIMHVPSTDVNGAANFLRDKITKDDVDKIGHFAQMVQDNPRQNLGDVGQHVQSLATNLFGDQARTWSNQKIANVFDAVLYRVGQSPNRAGLGLSTDEITHNYPNPTAPGEESVQPSAPETPKVSLEAPGSTERVSPPEGATPVPQTPMVSTLAHSIANDVKQPIGPQELNVNRLALRPDQQAHVASLETSELRQKLGDKQILDIASNAGLDTKTYTMDETAQKVAEQLNVRRNITTLENQLTQVTDPATREGIIRQIADSSRIARTQGTDIARQLSARRIIANELDTPIQRVFKLLEKAGVNPDAFTKAAATVDFNDANQVVHFYRSFVPAKASDWIDAVRYSSMLSSPNTHINNAASNLANTAIIAPIEHAVTGGLDFFHSALTGKPRTAFVGESGAYMKGYAGNVRQAIDRVVDVMTGKGRITNLDLTHAPIATTGVKGAAAKTLDSVSRLLEASDQFFTALTEGGEQGALKYRQGKGVTLSEGDIINQAAGNAKYRLYRDRLGKPGQGKLLDAVDFIPKKIMEARSSSNPIVKTIARFTVPFIATPTNIIKQGIEYSPLGLATLAGHTDKTAQVAKFLMGSTAAAGAATLLASGRLTWAEPTDPTKKQAFRAAGMQPYAVKVGNNWLSYTKLPPAVGFNLALISSLDDAIKNKTMKQSTADAVMAAAAKYGNFYADQSYFKQMGDLLAAVKGDPEKWSSYLSNYPQQLVPFRALSGWVARLTDPNQRAVDYKAGFIDQQMQQLMTNIPGLSEQVPARLDASGTPMPNQNRVLNAFSPVRVTTERPEQSSAFNDLTEMSRLRSAANAVTKTLPKTEAQQVKALQQADFTPVEKALLHMPTTARAQFIKEKLDTLKGSARAAYIDRLAETNALTDKTVDALISLQQGR